MAARMRALASRQPGFLGVETANEGRMEITVSYWKDEKSIKSWKEQADHQEAQRLGKENWYAQYFIRVAKVEGADSEKI